MSDPAMVTRISIEGNESLELIKTGGGWSLIEPGTTVPQQGQGSEEELLPADAGRIQAFLGILHGMDRLELVSTSRSSWAELGLAEGQAKHVVLYRQDGARLTSLSVGILDGTGNKSYLRLDSGERVYAGPSALASYLSSSRRSWLDLRVWDRGYSPNDVQTLTIRGSLGLPDGTILETDYRLTRSGTAWIADQPGMRLDTQKVEGLLRSILAARAEGYQEADRQLRPVLSISAILGDGSTLDLGILHGPTDERYTALSSRRPKPVILSAWTIRDLVRPLGTLLIPTP